MDPKAEVTRLQNNDIIVYANEDKVIEPNSSDFVRTGIRLHIPESCHVEFLSISSNYINSNVYIHPAKMKMYPNDQGELLVLLQNDGHEPFVITKKTSIAVLKIFKNFPIELKINEVSL